MAIATLVLTIGTAPIAWILYNVLCLVNNYLKAKKVGLSIVVLPIDPANPLWQVLDRKFMPLFRMIPFGPGTFTRFNYRGWDLKDRYHAHQELGDAFMIVSPASCWLHVCDVAAVADILKRKDDFTSPPEMLEMLAVFGPNLGTTEGPEWQRHHRVVATCFNDQNNEIVWSESIAQATDMVRHWSSKESINTVGDDTRTLSLHVMSAAGFGKSYPFRTEADATDAHDSLNIRNSLQMILDNCIPLVILGRNNLGKPWLPWKKLYQATLTFQEYMTSMYEEEKQALNLSLASKKSNNLMTTLVRASQGNSPTEPSPTPIDGAATSKPKPKPTLSEREIYGNMFVFSFAGHDTTANSLVFLLALLATRPETQVWLAEEINSVFLPRSTNTADDAKPDLSATSCAASFPRLKRCLATVHEVVRLYTPVGIIKTSGPAPRALTVGGKTIVVPARTMILPSYSAMHTDPRHWGEHSLEFRPERWIKKASAAADGSGSGKEEFLEFARGESPFVGWSGGIRGCPGRKFSQVEMVGVLVALFGKYKVRPVRLEGENEEMARERLLRLVRESAGFKLLLQMMHPENVVLKWEKR